MKTPTNIVKKPHKLGQKRKIFAPVHYILIPQRRRVVTCQNKAFLVKKLNIREKTCKLHCLVLHKDT